MAAINGFFGNIQGPFLKNEQIFTKIQEDCNNPINYISKIGFHYIGDRDLDIFGEKFEEPEEIFVKINEIEFQIGRTRTLELEDVEITSIKFMQDMDELCYIDYQYK